MAAASPAPRSQAWLFGPLPDLLLGCGLLYALLVAALPFVPLEATTLASIGLFGSLLIAAPHYGATLLRVYGRAEDRRKYRFFTVYLSAVVWFFFVLGLYDLAVGSAMITLYLTWSPWHYTGQNYGLAVMFLRRRQVSFSDATKRWLYGSFGLSYALVFLTLHRGLGDAGYGLDDFLGTPYRFVQLGIPVDAWRVSFVALGAAYLVVTAVAFARLRAGASERGALVPVYALATTQFLWFAVPNTWIWWTGTRLEAEGVAWLMIWKILSHSAQYLWVTTYYAVGRQRGRPRWAYLLATLGAGSAVWTLPAILFSPQTLGTHPYQMGLFLMIAAAVNLQHFLLDGAIWKLRDTGVGRILLASETPDAAAGVARERPWVRGGLWAAGAALTVFSLYASAERVAYGSAVRALDSRTALRAAERLARVGRDDPHFHILAARSAAEVGDAVGALDAYRTSIALYPTPDAFLGAAVMHQQLRELRQAEDALRESLALDARNAEAHRRLGLLLLESERPDEAIAALTRAARLRPGDGDIAQELARARAAARQRARRS